MDTLLFYINAINGGGAERVILQLAHHFAEVGYKSVLVTSFVDKENEYDVPSNVVRISMEQEQVIQSRIQRNISRIKKLRTICKHERPAAIISFMAEPNFRSIIATFGLPVKRIISVRNDPEKEYRGKIGRFVGKYILPFADGCVFQTNEAKEWFPLKLQHKSAVILNDVKEEFFNVKRKPTNTVVSVGRLSRQKNHSMLIKSFSKVSAEYPEQKLLIYGSGNLKEELLSLIKELQLEDKAFLMGATNDIAAVLSSAGIFVLSSDYEGMPNCLMEALAAGVPSISTDCPCGGPRALICDGVDGVLVPVGNEEIMASSIKKLLSDTQYTKSLGENAKQSSKKFYPDVIFDQWREYVEKVIKE